MAFQSSTAASLTFAEDLGTDVVHIYVGPERKHYVVHKQPLISGSDYFNKALTGNFKEATENSIHLEEADPSAVALMIGWIYRGTIPGMDRIISPFTRSATSTVESPALVPNANSINGTQYPYAPTVNTHSDLTGRELYTHICAQPQYTAFSSEELRFSDYGFGKQFPRILGGRVPLDFNNRSIVPAAPRGLFGLPSSIFANQAPSTGISQESNLFGHLVNPSVASGTATITNATANPTYPLFGPRNTTANQTHPLFGPQSQNPVKNQSIQGSSSSLGLQNHPPSSPYSTGSLGTGLANQSNNSMAHRQIADDTSSNESSSDTEAQQNTANSGVQSKETSAATSGSIPHPISSRQALDTDDVPNNMFAAMAATRISNTSNLDQHTNIGIFPDSGQPRSQDSSMPESISDNNLSQPMGSSIPEIPRGKPFSQELSQHEALQLTLVNLCIFAETFCWPALFNAAIEAYIRGELSLFRPIPVEHVDMIYDQTHSQSSLRKFSLESIFSSASGTENYIEIARRYNDLFEDIMRQIAVPRQSGALAISESTIRSYHMKPANAGKQKDAGDVDMGKEE